MSYGMGPFLHMNNAKMEKKIQIEDNSTFAKLFYI